MQYGGRVDANRFLMSPAYNSAATRIGILRSNGGNIYTGDGETAASGIISLGGPCFDAAYQNGSGAGLHQCGVGP